MAISTAKEVRVMFDEVLDQIEHQQQMAVLAEKYNATGSELQNSNNAIWRQIEQQAPVKEGWEFVDGDFGSLIELSYPANLGLPMNGLSQIRADDFRDKQFMQRRAKAEAARLLADQNSKIANLVKDTGSIYFNATVDGTSGNTGYDAIREVSTILRERQANTDMGISVFLNDRDASLISADIANRSNMNGLPESTYKNGLIAPLGS